MIDDEDGRQIEWEGLPISIEQNIEGDYETLRAYPLMCINMAMSEQIESTEGLRPYDEIKNVVAQSIDLSELNPADYYERMEQIGEGGYGQVYKVKRKTDGKLFAMKYVPDVQPAEKTLVINEASLIAHLKSEELIQCVDLYDYGKSIFIILELMDQGAMTDICIDYYKNYSEDFCRYSLYKAAKGLLAMHNKNVLHRDIKSDNILFSEDGQIKITDLGFSCFLSEQQSWRKTKKGTPNWIAPEIVKGTQYSKEIDVWSFGCFAYELATGKPPFANVRSRRQLIHNIINVDVPDIPDRWSDEFRNFVKCCLNRDSKQRYTINQLLFQHDFLAGIDQEKCKETWH